MRRRVSAHFAADVCFQFARISQNDNIGLADLHKHTGPDW